MSLDRQDAGLEVPPWNGSTLHTAELTLYSGSVEPSLSATLTPAARAPIERIVLHASPRYFYRKLALGLVALASGAAVLALELPPWIGWALVGLGGGYGLLQLRALGEETERVVIDDSGIRDSMLPVGTIGWDEVRGAAVQQIGQVRVVALRVRDPERFIRRLPPARQFIARKALEADLPGLYITLVGTDGDPDTIAQAITQRVRISDFSG